MSNQIEQIKKAEKEAEDIVNTAHEEVKKKMASVKSVGEKQVAATVHRLNKEIAEIDKRAEFQIKSEQTKIAAAEKKELADLAKVKTADTEKAVDLIIKQVLK